jgi:uncharacterized protein YueI
MKWTDKKNKDGMIVSSEAVAEPFRLVIHHYMGCGDTWYFSTYLGPYEQRELDSVRLDDAKQEAVKLFTAQLEAALYKLEH